MRGIGKGEIFRDVMDRLRAKYELTLGFREHTLADEVRGADADRTLDVVAVDRASSRVSQYRN